MGHWMGCSLIHGPFWRANTEDITRYAKMILEAYEPALSLSVLLWGGWKHPSLN